MNAMEKFCADQRAKIIALQNEIYDEQKARADELLKLNIELVWAKSDFKAALYEIESLKSQVNILKGLLDDENKRQMDPFK